MSRSRACTFILYNLSSSSSTCDELQNHLGILEPVNRGILEVLVEIAESGVAASADRVKGFGGDGGVREGDFC
jgi:hypothetical protein